MVKVEKIADMGAYVQILEYNNIEGMILMSELSRRRIRSINKLIRVGRNEVVVVIRVDKDKGYIDLSKRRVSSDEVVKCEERYAKGKAVNSILRHVAERLGYDEKQLEDFYQRAAWHFDQKLQKDAVCYDVFKQSVTDPSIFDECNLSDDEKKELLENIRRRLMTQAVKIRADLEVACYGYAGIDAIKETLRAGLATSCEETPIKINLIAPPLYVVTAQTMDKMEGLNAVRKAVEAIKARSTQVEGTCKVIMEPKVVSDVEESQLAKQLEALELANKEVAGDDDDEEEENENELTE